MLAIAHPLPEGWLGGRLERGGRGGRRFPSTQVGSQPRRHVVRAAGRFKSSVLVWRACGGERWAGGAGAVLQSYPILDQVRAALQSLCLIGLTDSLARQSKLQQRGKATGGGWTHDLGINGASLMASIWIADTDTLLGTRHFWSPRRAPERGRRAPHRALGAGLPATILLAALAPPSWRAL
jgi:hypothetical protein